jgi:hypothetical protein
MQRIVKFLSFLLFLVACSGNAFGWGFWAHQRINRMAVFTLPPEMLVLYKANIEYLTEHAVDPDKRRYAVDGEAARHYIDIDHYGHYPFPDLPRYWEAAVEKYSEDTLQSYGIVPWYVPMSMKKLTEAFKYGDLQQIMRISADLGHYISDAHVPLHTTENYNGQLTGQKGIHGFWESRLPELFAEDYNFFVGKAYYSEDELLETWDAVLESHAALDSVLSFEAALSQRFPENRKYGFESRNNTVVRTYSREYALAYHDTLDGMVERRMRRAILRTGSLWHTAWKNAGSPDLHKLLDQSIRKERRDYKRRLKIIDRESEVIGLAPQKPTHFIPEDCGYYRQTYITYRSWKSHYRKAEKLEALGTQNQTWLSQIKSRIRDWLS